MPAVKRNNSLNDEINVENESRNLAGENSNTECKWIKQNCHILPRQGKIVLKSFLPLKVVCQLC